MSSAPILFPRMERSAESKTLVLAPKRTWMSSFIAFQKRAAIGLTFKPNSGVSSAVSKPSTVSTEKTTKPPIA
jgi:hypothetical protein